MKSLYQSALALAGLVFTTGAAQAVPAFTVTDLNLRYGPGVGYGIIATMPAGSPIELGDCYQDGWCEVEWAGYAGYASENYLEVAGYAPPVYSPPPVTRYYSANRYYYGPGYSYGYRPPVVQKRVIVKKPVIVHKKVIVKKPPVIKKKVIVKRRPAAKRPKYARGRPHAKRPDFVKRKVVVKKPPAARKRPAVKRKVVVKRPPAARKRVNKKVGQAANRKRVANVKRDRVGRRDMSVKRNRGSEARKGRGGGKRASNRGRGNGGKRRR